MLIEPQSVDELRDVVRSLPALLAVGNRTKPPLSAVEGAALVSLNRVTGILEYEPSEFTFTARAGTRVADVAAALREKRQYLPFDPPLVAAGATLGGCVAAGLSGPGRLRYGGIRDFVLGVRLICGDGELITAGGRVVKNAAGFDIPKLIIGSLGRLGVITELTFKVFPEPPGSQTYRVACDSDEQAMERMSQAAVSRWELDAIDYRPAELAIYVRLRGPDAVNASIAREMVEIWQGIDSLGSNSLGSNSLGSNSLGIDSLDIEQARAFWQSIGELNWLGEDATVVKVPTTASEFLQLRGHLDSLNGVGLHVSVAGAVTWIAVESETQLGSVDRTLSQVGLSGLVIRGPGSSIWLGRRTRSAVESAIKQALDPDGRFPAVG